MIQIIASDMDGTLLNDKMVISKRNADAIKEAQKNGVHFIVSSADTAQLSQMQGHYCSDVQSVSKCS